MEERKERVYIHQEKDGRINTRTGSACSELSPTAPTSPANIEIH